MILQALEYETGMKKVGGFDFWACDLEIFIALVIIII